MILNIFNPKNAKQNIIIIKNIKKKNKNIKLVTNNKLLRKKWTYVNLTVL